MPQLVIERSQIQKCAVDCQVVDRCLYTLANHVDPSLRASFSEARRKMQRVTKFLEHMDEQVQVASDELLEADDPKPKGRARKKRSLYVSEGRLLVSDSPNYTAADFEGLGD